MFAQITECPLHIAGVMISLPVQHQQYGLALPFSPGKSPTSSWNGGLGGLLLPRQHLIWVN